MLVKARVWEPGKADPSPTRTFDSMEGFATLVTGLNPGDSVSFILPFPTKEGLAVITPHLVMESDKPTLHEDLWEMINGVVAPWLTEEQQAVVAAKAQEIVRQHDRI
jgi:hypothetical protein